MVRKNSGRRPRIILVVDYKRRFVWFQGEDSFTPSLATGSIRILKKLNKLSRKPIIFYISGIGGDMYAFTKLAHAIEKIESPVAFVAFDFVRSGCFWITQCGDACSAVAGTKFMFHRAVHHRPSKTTMSQIDYFRGLNELMLVDAVQFWIFTRRGSPIKTVLKLFEQEATLSVKKAIKLNLVAVVYDKSDFNKHRKRTEKLAQRKYKF